MTLFFFFVVKTALENNMCSLNKNVALIKLFECFIGKYIESKLLFIYKMQAYEHVKTPCNAGSVTKSQLKEWNFKHWKPKVISSFFLNKKNQE